MSNILTALSYGGTVAIIGMLIVFLGLAILIGAIYFLSALLRKMLSMGEKKTAAPAPAAPAPAPAPAPVVEEPVVEEVVDDAELIAVIAAALAAFDKSNKTLVVRKVRRVSAWNKSSRQEQVTRF